MTLKNIQIFILKKSNEGCQKNKIMNARNGNVLNNRNKIKIS
jgi:hypothetical protein